MSKYQVIFDALLVTDINEYMTEHTGMTPFVHGNRHTALQHILQKPHRLQTNRLTPGIRPRNQQNALFTGQLDIKRNTFFPCLAKEICRSG